MEEDLSFDMINKTWKKPALQAFLRARNLKVSRSRQELVARAFSAAEQNVEICADAKERELQSKTEMKNLLLTPEGTLPDPMTLNDGWVGEKNGMVLWPPIFLSDITMYLMKDHPGNDVSLQRRLLNEYKEGAYRLYEGGWLKEIQMHVIDEKSQFSFLKAKCTPSMKLNDVPHVWICANKKSGDIHSAYCSCTAG